MKLLVAMLLCVHAASAHAQAPVYPAKPVRIIVAAAAGGPLVTLAKAKPGAINYGSAGVGNLQHLAMELLMSMAQIRMNHVPYKSFAPASVDLISGQIELMFANITGAISHVKQNRLRAIAVSSAARTPLVPGLAPVADTYPGFDVTTWMGLFAPAGTPKEAIATVHNDIARVLRLPEMSRHFSEQGADIIAGPPERLSEYVRRDYARYGQLIKEIGLTPE